LVCGFRVKTINMRHILALLVALTVAPTAFAELPVAKVQVVHTYPHDRHAYTEGLFYRDGFLYESTGQEGHSSIRKVRLEDGVVLQSRAELPGLFGEGIVDWDDQIVSLTWRNEIGYRWNIADLSQVREFHYTGEGWALTRNIDSLIMSDGTPVLKFLDPISLEETRRITVTAEGEPVVNLNELEWVKGEILANIWLTNRIARIDPNTGAVKGWIDVGNLPEAAHKVVMDDIPNGIAYDAEHDRLFLTGKDWPHLYEVKLVP
jgi:glutamine cyclotransferase